MRNFPKNIPLSGRVKACLAFVQSQKPLGKTVIDIGSSFGWLEKELVTSRAHLIGIEPNKEAVSFARVDVGSSVKFIVGNALEIPLADKIADLVLFFDVIEHLPNATEKNALAEINRILKNNGTLLLTTPNSHPLTNYLDPAWYFGHRHYSKNTITHLLKESGFKILDFQIKGNIFSLVYILWFYFNKWVLTPIKLQNGFLEEQDDKGYQMTGIATIFLKAQKMN